MKATVVARLAIPLLLGSPCAAGGLPVFLADNHAETFGWITRTFDLDEPHTLVLIDAHPDSNSAERSEQVREQLATSAAVLADLLGAPPAHLAPPRGGYDATVRAVAAETGYTFCRTMRWGYNRPLDPLAIEIAPVTGAWGTWFLHEALRARNERLVKTLFFLKLGLRDSLGPLDYRKIRNTVAKLARG